LFGGFAILLLFLFAGEILSYAGVGLPGNVLGMILLALALSLRIVKIDQVKASSDLLLKNLAFFFVPAGIGIMAHGELLRRYWFEISLVLVVSTILVLLSVGMLHRLLLRSGKGRPE